jgi:DNA-binding MarR family transcriptional regulator
VNEKEKCEKIMKVALDIHKKLFAVMLKDVEPSLSKSHVYILADISLRGECTVTDIANHLEITLSAVTSLVDKLCSADLVTRVRSEEDRRVVFLKLTEKGEKVLGIIEKNKNTLMKKVFSDITAEEFNSFFGTIEKITRNILESNENEI